MKRIYVAAAGMFLLLIPGLLWAQNRFLASVRDQLLAAGIVLVQRGYELTHEPYTGELRRGEKDTVTLTLHRDVDYGLMAVCDQDCSDLDIGLYDENDNRIASDIEEDDHPVVTVTPRWTGKFKIVVSMARCSDQPCYYGIGVFGRD